jgi:hypothetical protein
MPSWVTARDHRHDVRMAGAELAREGGGHLRLKAAGIVQRACVNPKTGDRRSYVLLERYASREAPDLRPFSGRLDCSSD